MMYHTIYTPLLKIPGLPMVPTQNACLSLFSVSAPIVASPDASAKVKTKCILNTFS